MMDQSNITKPLKSQFFDHSNSLDISISSNYHVLLNMVDFVELLGDVMAERSKERSIDGSPEMRDLRKAYYKIVMFLGNSSLLYLPRDDASALKKCYDVLSILRDTGLYEFRKKEAVL